MSSSIRLTIYTQTNCVYCEIMKHKLDTWGYEYDVVNLNIRPEAKSFMKIAGHKTVPQLYWNKTHLNKVDTADFTKNNLEEQLDYDNYAGGVESWGR